MIAELRRILLRDIGGVRAELELYPDDATPWRSVPGLPNPGGTLALHLAGNLRHFVGAELGGTGYVRDRAAEFTARDLPRAELVARIQAAHDEVAATLAGLQEGRLDEPYPALFRGRPIGTRLFLLHLAAHLGYHLGQLDYHRRTVTGDAAGANVLALDALLEPL